MVTRLWRLATDERGQDLVEYALLAAFIALVGVAAFTLISNSMNASYVSWDQAEQELWEVEDPQ